MDGIVNFLGTEAAFNAIVLIISAVVGVILKLRVTQKYNLDRCALALQSAVQEVYECYVRGLKEASEDGTLTDSEKEYARNEAWVRAKHILEEEGIDLLKYYSPRIAKSIIETLVNDAKISGYQVKIAEKNTIPQLPAILLCLCIPLLGGCAFGFKRPAEINAAAQMRTEAYGRYALNNERVLDTILEAYRGSEYARIEMLFEKDLAKVQANYEKANPQIPAQLVDAVTTLHQRKMEARAKVNQRIGELSTVVMNARKDLALAARLDEVVSRFSTHGMDTSAVQKVVLDVMNLIREKTNDSK
jgi:lipocalin